MTEELAGACWRGSESKQGWCPKPQATEGSCGAQSWLGARYRTGRWEQRAGSAPWGGLPHFCSWAAAVPKSTASSCSQFRRALRCSAVTCSRGIASTYPYVCMVGEGSLTARQPCRICLWISVSAGLPWEAQDSGAVREAGCRVSSEKADMNRDDWERKNKDAFLTPQQYPANFTPSWSRTAMQAGQVPSVLAGVALAWKSHFKKKEVQVEKAMYTAGACGQEQWGRKLKVLKLGKALAWKAL